VDVLCYGDSNTYGFDPRSYFGDRFSAKNRWVDILMEKTGWDIVNDGVNGRCIPRSALSFSQHFDLIIIMLGTNDLLQGSSLSEIAMKMKLFLCSVAAPKVLLVSPPHLQQGAWVSDCTLIERSKQLSAIYREIAEQNEMFFADANEWNIELLFDGVHFSEKGHHAFAEGLYRFINKENFHA